MADTLPARERRSRAPAILLALTALGAVQAAAWVYFRNRQPDVDAQTRGRLQPKGARP